MSSQAGPSSHPIEVFFCYSHQDERYRDELETHFAPLLRDGTIPAWHDLKIAPGTACEEDSDRHLRSAQVVLLLVSANFFESDYCYNEEMTRALERERAGQVRVIPILLRPVEGWAQSPFGRLQALPRDGKPVIKWQHRDDAYVQIARGVRQVAKELAARPPDKENPVIGRGGITNGADFHGSERTLNTAVESPMPRVFICHSIRDRDFVEREIIVLLRQHGLEPWYAVDDLQTAAVWDQCILQALEACDWFLIILSSHSEASEWVRDELHWAIENRPPGRIIPVLIEDCRPWKFHLRLNRIQFVDFRKDREKSRRRLPCSPDCPHGPSPPPSA